MHRMLSAILFIIMKPASHPKPPGAIPGCPFAGGAVVSFLTYLLTGKEGTRSQKLMSGYNNPALVIKIYIYKYGGGIGRGMFESVHTLRLPWVGFIFS